MLITSPRNKMIFIAVSLMLVTQLVFTFLNYRSAHSIFLESLDSYVNSVTIRNHAKVITTLRYISSISANLDSEEFTSYSSSNYNLRAPIEARKSLEILNERINDLQISSDLIDTVYIIGSNKNQPSYAKSIKTSSWLEEDIPNISDLADAKLLDIFLQSYGVPVFYPKDSLLKQLGNIPDDNNSSDLNKIRKMFQRFEGNIVINNGINISNVLTFIVIKPDIFNNLSLSEQSSKDLNWAILNKKDELIWSDCKDEKLLKTTLQNVTIKNKNDPSYISFVENIKVESDEIEPYGLHLINFRPIKNFNTQEIKLLYKFIINALIALLITIFISVKISGWIINPLKKLSREMQNLHQSFPLIPVSLEKFSTNKLTRFSIKSKIFLLFLIGVIIPASLFGLIHSNNLFSFSKFETEEKMHLKAVYLANDIQFDITLYESLISRLSVNEGFYRYLTSLPQIPSSIIEDNTITKFFGVLNNVSYFVLFNSEGNPKYSSIFNNNLDLFKINPIGLTNVSNKKNIIWIAQDKNIYNQPSLSLIKKIYTNSNSQSTKEFLGYLQLVLTDSAF
ncbi:MAG TPA: hypothetical protein VIK86_00035, partial [Candidatus Paceibacterota bacterium]